jgi:hypothetical protein
MPAKTSKRLPTNSFEYAGCSTVEAAAPAAAAGAEVSPSGCRGACGQGNRTEGEFLHKDKNPNGESCEPSWQ